MPALRAAPEHLGVVLIELAGIVGLFGTIAAGCAGVARAERRRIASEALTAADSTDELVGEIATRLRRPSAAEVGRVLATCWEIEESRPDVVVYLIDRRRSAPLAALGSAER
jgi:hypothetical protein